MKLSRRLIAVLFLLGGVAPLQAQSIITMNGTPDPNYPAFYAWYTAAKGLNAVPSPLPDGTSVAYWEDQTPNARHLTRVDSAVSRQPVAHDRLESGGPAVFFDGDDYIWAAVGDPFGRLSNPRTILVIADAFEADRGYIFDSSTRSGRTALWRCRRHRSFPGHQDRHRRGLRHYGQPEDPPRQQRLRRGYRPYLRG